MFLKLTKNEREKNFENPQNNRVKMHECIGSIGIAEEREGGGEPGDLGLGPLLMRRYTMQFSLIYFFAKLCL